MLWNIIFEKKPVCEIIVLDGWKQDGHNVQIFWKGKLNVVSFMTINGDQLQASESESTG